MELSRFLSIEDQIFDPKTYSVTVSDGCGASGELTINAQIQRG